MLMLGAEIGEAAVKLSVDQRRIIFATRQELTSGDIHNLEEAIESGKLRLEYRYFELAAYPIFVLNAYILDRPDDPYGLETYPNVGSSDIPHVGLSDKRLLEVASQGQQIAITFHFFAPDGSLLFNAGFPTVLQCKEMQEDLKRVERQLAALPSDVEEHKRRYTQAALEVRQWMMGRALAIAEPPIHTFLFSSESPATSTSTKESPTEVDATVGQEVAESVISIEGKPDVNAPGDVKPSESQPAQQPQHVGRIYVSLGLPTLRLNLTERNTFRAATFRQWQQYIEASDPALAERVRRDEFVVVERDWHIMGEAGQQITAAPFAEQPIDPTDQADSLAHFSLLSRGKDFTSQVRTDEAIIIPSQTGSTLEQSLALALVKWVQAKNSDRFADEMAVFDEAMQSPNMMWNEKGRLEYRSGVQDPYVGVVMLLHDNPTAVQDAQQRLRAEAAAPTTRPMAKTEADSLSRWVLWGLPLVILVCFLISALAITVDFNTESETKNPESGETDLAPPAEVDTSATEIALTEYAQGYFATETAVSKFTLSATSALPTRTAVPVVTLTPRPSATRPSSTPSPTDSPTPTPSATPPTSSPMPPTPSVTYDTSVVSATPILSVSPTSGPASQHLVTPAEPTCGIYVVKPNDTAYSIAHDLEVDLFELLELNGIAPGSLIAPGQSLKIPGADCPE